jgi:hypothetical protein
MRRITIGFGEFEGHTLAEVSTPFLQELAVRFPLDPDEDDASNETLLIIIGVHAEVGRRAAGGKAIQRIPTRKELALEVVKKGHHQLSKLHHPDVNGNKETQQRINEMKDFLMEACNGIQDDDSYAIVIGAPVQTTTDDDIPF